MLSLFVSLGVFLGAGVASQAFADEGYRRAVAALPMVWRIERAEGRTQVERQCFVVSLGDDLVLRLAFEPGRRQAVWSVSLGYDNARDSLRYLRVNKRIFTTAEARFEGRQARAIVAGLSGPGEFAFEWAWGPGYLKRQGLFGTGDFAAKAAACEAWLGGSRT